MEPQIIEGIGYKKIVLNRKSGQNEVSVLEWQPGSQSKPHDHNVTEKTYVLSGRIFEVRRIGNKHYDTKHYEAGDFFEVPAGTEHVVGVDAKDGPAVTINVCAGLLSMNILENFATIIVHENL